MPRTRPPYPPELRREAIRLVRASEEEHPIPKLATELLGLTAETLRNWIKQAQIDTGERKKGSPQKSARNSEGVRGTEKASSPRSEGTATRERDPPKSATAFFAREERGGR